MRMGAAASVPALSRWRRVCAARLCRRLPGFPAVTALLSLVNADLDALRHSDRREFDAAKQFVGWAVGVIMRAHFGKVVISHR
jgi:hypothetical protein